MPEQRDSSAGGAVTLLDDVDPESFDPGLPDHDVVYNMDHRVHFPVTYDSSRMTRAFSDVYLTGILPTGMVFVIIFLLSGPPRRWFGDVVATVLALGLVAWFFWRVLGKHPGGGWGRWE